MLCREIVHDSALALKLKTAAECDASRAAAASVANADRSSTMPAMTQRLRRWVEWVGSHGAGVLVALLVVVAGTWGFVELLDEVQEGQRQDFDERVVRALALILSR